MLKLVVIYYDKLMEKDKIVQSGQSPTVAFMHKHFKHNSKKIQLSKPFQEIYLKIQITK